MDSQGLHEEYRRRDPVKVGSDRSFGFVFAVVFGLIGGAQTYKGTPWGPWALAAAVVFLLAALVRPQVLAPLNQVWYRFGLLLHKIVNPVIMGLIFYLAVAPTALVMRLMGKDPLRLRFDRTATTYWIERPPTDPQTMRNQF
jgi:hypothetical protein